MSWCVHCYYRENKAKCGSVCVANHTTPIDVVMLAVDNCFTLVSQIYGQFLAIIVDIIIIIVSVICMLL